MWSADRISVTAKVLLIASALTPTKELEPESKGNAGLVHHGVLDIASRTFEVNTAMLVDALPACISGIACSNCQAPLIPPVAGKLTARPKEWEGAFPL